MKIAIAGYGIEGESNLKYFSKDPANEVTVVDENNPSKPVPDGVKAIVAEDVMSKLDGYDLVVRTAGLAPTKIKTDGKIWSSTNEFFSKCPAMIIGVTGTKGKGTTASLIASILDVAGKKVWLVGNIGKPPLDVLDQIQPDDIVVFELSSFQLWDLQFSPRVAIVLFIEQEHLDVHADINEYIEAKSNITKYQTSEDILIYKKDNPYSTGIAKQSKAKTIGYPDSNSAHVVGDDIYYGEQKICSTSSLKIVGRHNLDNACAAIDAIWTITNDNTAIENGLSSFTGLEHRLKFVREVDGVKYYDDSIATTPSSAIAALRSFSSPKIIILGGSSKGADFSELAYELNNHSVQAILIGDEAKRMAESFNKAGFRNYEIIENPTMEGVVRRAHDLATEGDVVLLSPATASFGLFKNYSDRGDQFVSAVNSL